MTAISSINTGGYQPTPSPVDDLQKTRQRADVQKAGHRGHHAHRPAPAPAPAPVANPTSSSLLDVTA